MSLSVVQGDGLQIVTHKKLRVGEWVTHLEIRETSRDRVTRVNLTADTTRRLADQLSRIAEDMGK